MDVLVKAALESGRPIRCQDSATKLAAGAITTPFELRLPVLFATRPILKTHDQQETGQQ